MMAFFTTSSGVVMAQNYILGASVIGFVLYPFVKKWFNFTKKICILASLIIVVVSMYFLYVHPSYGILLLFGLICYVVFGMWGSHIYGLVARTWKRKGHIARDVGIAYALGVGIQFVNNNLVVNVLVQLISIVCSMVLMLYLAYKEDISLQRNFVEAIKQTSKQNKRGMLLIAIVALMACVFSSLDNAVTLVHAEGVYNISKLPRIILVVSGLVAGFLFDLKKRKYMYLSMYCVTLLSVISIVVMQFGGSFIVGLIMFYLSGGFFVVFFSTAFIDLSYECRKPDLWAGLGHAVNNACAIVTSALSVFLLQRQSGLFIVIMSLILLMGITVCMFFYTSNMLNPVTDRKREENDSLNEEEKFLAFCNTYFFTERECEVMHALLQNDMKMQDIASTLFISRTALYRHVAKINEKTQTKNRISLLQFYNQWKK